MLEMVRKSVYAAQPVALLAEWYTCPCERGQLAADMSGAREGTTPPDGFRRHAWYSSDALPGGRSILGRRRSCTCGKGHGQQSKRQACVVDKITIISRQENKHFAML